MLYILNIGRDGDVCDAPIGESSPACQVDSVRHMSRAHDPVVVHANVDEQLVEFHILLGVRIDQIVISEASNGQDRLSIQLRIIEAVQQVDTSGTRGREAHAQSPGKFRITACHECRRFLMSNLNETNALLTLPQGFHNAVNAITGKSENRIHTPFD